MRGPFRFGGRDFWVVAALVALAALLRFATLDAKGFWQDEAETVFLLRRDLGGMLDELRHSGATPPLYFLMARAWTGVFGKGEVGLRSLSALFGAAAVPVAYLAGRGLVTRRAGLIAAALVAVNPLLVWYGQEGRAYSLLVLLAGLAFLFFARALSDPSPLNLGLWAACSSLATATHYFAVFPFLAEAAWLLSERSRRRGALWAAGAATAADTLLLPYVLGQGGPVSEGTWIEHVGLGSRVVQIPGILLVGFETPAPLLAAGLATALAAVALGLVIVRGTAAERRGAWIAAAVGAAAIILPLGAALVGYDYLLYRNVLAGALPLAVLLGAGLGAAGSRRLGTGAAAALVALSVAIVALTAWEPKYHRDDWRSAASSLGPATGGRVVAATPALPAWDPLEYYLPGARPLRQGGAVVREIDLLALPNRRLGSIAETRLPHYRTPPPPVPGMRLVERRRRKHYLLVRYRSRVPVRVTLGWMRGSRLGPKEAAVLVQPAS